MVSWKSAFAYLGVLLLYHHARPCRAHPALNTISEAYTPNYNYVRDVGVFSRAAPRDFYLRIMPLGASITAGAHGEGENDPHNGYRKFLRDKLRDDGWNVNMVGNKRDGSMNDKVSHQFFTSIQVCEPYLLTSKQDHEGVSGERVKAVKARAVNSVPYWLPNVVLINAGTNDATQRNPAEDEPIVGTGNRMRELINKIFELSPDTVVVLSTLLPNDAQQQVNIINEEYRQLYREYAANSAKIILAEMADGFIEKDQIHDGTHPTVLGNMNMAAVWYWAINEANTKGWLSAPRESSNFKDDDEFYACRKEFGSGAGDLAAGRQVLYAANSVIQDDGTYKHASTPRTDRKASWKGDDDTRVWFAQLINHGAPKLGERDEVIYVSGNSADRVIKIRENEGDGVYNREYTIDVKDGCLTRGKEKVPGNLSTMRYTLTPFYHRYPLG